MFFKNSRYRRLKNEAVPDKEGNVIKEKEFRLLPPADGRYLHMLNEGDRLDHLAHRFYGQSRKWWRICDANPLHLSPIALMGKEALAVTRFLVTYEGTLCYSPPATNGTAAVPPLSLLVQHLKVQCGVVKVLTAMQPHLEKYSENGTRGTREKRLWYADISYNINNITKEDLITIIEAEDFSVSEILDIKPFGKKIIIPADTIE